MRKGANSKGRLFEIARLFLFFQSSPNLTKSLIFHWQCEATIIVKSVGEATSFLLPPFFLSLSLPWPNVELCAQFFPVISPN